ncbi:hypothetical protein B0T25DRAFT_482206 [Lasiosphaeria hispida]|uniref:Ubiquitin-like domain-containing protein n=1 Tax=Lasiosphaeria hispida TaxID=260671 RepID=A0AAJ0HEY7_9PEZI|nr:hypothetical protein B0T25DRAFT_482206 [Lasiosphaeria hispida]
MEVALTFGSLGDIIAVCQIAIQLGKALGVGCAGGSSSAREYQELRSDLDTFVQVLMHVVATYEQHEFSLSLESLARTTKTVVDECGSLIKQALDRLASKYNEALQPGGSGNKLKDGYRKVEWLVKEEDRLHELRGKLGKNTERLSVLVSLATRQSLRANNATVIARIKEVRTLLDERQQTQQALLASYQSRNEVLASHQSGHITRIHKTLDTHGASLGSILCMTRSALHGIFQVKGMLVDLAENVVNLQVLVSNPTYLRPLDPTKDLPITLEDAFGYRLTLPEEWINDWEDLHGLLEMRFKKKKGYDMVLQRQFALEESCTGNDLDRSCPLKACLRRGMKVDMSMVFATGTVLRGSCPRCKTPIDATEGVTIQCQKKYCGIWFRSQSAPLLEEEGANIPQTNLEMGTITLKHPGMVSIAVKPSDFQRVRLLSQAAAALVNANKTRDASYPGDQILLRSLGSCTSGYAWCQVNGGWRCYGGMHFVSDTELASWTVGTPIR